MIGALCNSKDVGWDFIPPLGTVDTDSSHGVDREPLVRVDRDAEQSRVGVNELVLIPHHRIPQDTSIIEIGQASHILRAVKLRWVDLADLILLKNFGLKY